MAGCGYRASFVLVNCALVLLRPIYLTRSHPSQVEFKFRTGTSNEHSGVLSVGAKKQEGKGGDRKPVEAGRVLLSSFFPLF